MQCIDNNLQPKVPGGRCLNASMKATLPLPFQSETKQITSISTPMFGGVGYSFLLKRIASPTSPKSKQVRLVQF